MIKEQVELIKYICEKTGFRRNELGSSSITFKADGIHLTVYRAGKKVKDVSNSKILYGWSIEDGIEVCKAIQEQLKSNAENKATSIPLSERLKAKRVREKEKEVSEDDW